MLGVNFQWESHGKSRPFGSSGAGGMDDAAVRFHNGFRNRETQAEAAKFPRDDAIRLLERREDAVGRFRTETHARVAHLHDEPSGLVARSNVDAAFVGRELGGILEQVPEDLLQALAVPVRR